MTCLDFFISIKPEEHDFFAYFELKNDYISSISFRDAVAVISNAPVFI